jgi:polyhydroxybutyrate depolymerase
MSKRFFLLSLSVFILIACRQTATLSPTATSAPEESPTQVSIADPVPAAGNYDLNMDNEGDARDVVLHLPPAYDGESKLPLVIVLHGGAGNGEHIQRLTEMDADADEYGFVVAYPDGSGRLDERLFTWNAGHCCGYAFENNTDDIGFLELLIDRLVSHYNIDPQRVYIAGISNGGMMAYRAGVELADKVAAIAPIAGSIGGQASANTQLLVPNEPSHPVAVIAFHGMEDQHVLYIGGNSPLAVDGRIDLSVAGSINFWVSANACDTVASQETQAEGNIVIDRYTNCNGGADVVLFTIVDGGHAWPGARRGLVSDLPTQDISANQMMLEFFLAHPKP